MNKLGDAKSLITLGKLGDLINLELIKG